MLGVSVTLLPTFFCSTDFSFFCCWGVIDSADPMKGELAIFGRIWGQKKLGPKKIGNSKDDQNLRTLGPEMN